jgi:hypothetical protein
MIPYETSVFYMRLGFGVFFGVMAIYLASLFLRWRNLRRDEETLNEIQGEHKK